MTRKSHQDEGDYDLNDTPPSPDAGNGLVSMDTESRKNLVVLEQSQKWKCSFCSFINVHSRSICILCNYPRS